MRDLSVTDRDWTDDPISSFDTASLIDRHSMFDGSFRSQRDLRVEGELKGNVTCEGTLFVSEGATIAAIVEAEHITVAGELTGEIRCRGRLQILPSGKVRANVATGSLVIQEGAIYEGQLEMVGIELSSLRPLRARTSIAPSSGDLEQMSASRETARHISGDWGVLKRPGNQEKGQTKAARRTKHPNLTIQPASPGRQARSHEVYNPLLSWSLAIRGADAGAVRFDWRAAAGVAGMRHVPVL